MAWVGRTLQKSNGKTLKYKEGSGLSRSVSPSSLKLTPQTVPPSSGQSTEWAKNGRKPHSTPHSAFDPIVFQTPHFCSFQFVLMT